MIMNYQLLHMNSLMLLHKRATLKIKKDWSFIELELGRFPYALN